MNALAVIAAATLVVGVPAAIDLDDIPEPSGEPVATYDRDLFGRWADLDGNGCDTRNDILARDFTDYSLLADGASSCPAATVGEGVLLDPYTGKEIIFNRAEDPQAVQIDHVVPLSWAWQNGAEKWGPDKRVAFANDPANLLAVDGAENGRKSDSGPSQWMPPNEAFQCHYATQFADVVANYGLTLPAEDRLALEDALTSCDTAAAPTTPAQAPEEASRADQLWKVVVIAVAVAAVASYATNGHQK